MNKVFIAIGSLVFIVTGLVALVSINRGSGLVVPGFAPVTYIAEKPVPLKVNKITSHHTQIPFAYFSLEGVCPTDKVGDNENLGEVIMGDRLMEHSGYKVRFCIALPQFSIFQEHLSTRVPTSVRVPRLPFFCQLTNLLFP